MLGRSFRVRVAPQVSAEQYVQGVSRHPVEPARETNVRRIVESGGDHGTEEQNKGHQPNSILLLVRPSTKRSCTIYQISRCSCQN